MKSGFDLKQHKIFHSFVTFTPLKEFRRMENQRDTNLVDEKVHESTGEIKL